MKYVPVVLVVGFFLFAGLIGSNIVSFFKNTQTRYNCELAEISPDFPIKAKQECRELRIKDEQRNTKGDSVTSGR